MSPEERYRREPWLQIPLCLAPLYTTQFTVLCSLSRHDRGSFYFDTVVWDLPSAVRDFLKTPGPSSSDTFSPLTNEKKLNISPTSKLPLMNIQLCGKPPGSTMFGNLMRLSRPNKSWSTLITEQAGWLWRWVEGEEMGGMLQEDTEGGSSWIIAERAHLLCVSYSCSFSISQVTTTWNLNIMWSVCDQSQGRHRHVVTGWDKIQNFFFLFFVAQSCLRVSAYVSVLDAVDCGYNQREFLFLLGAN